MLQCTYLFVKCWSQFAHSSAVQHCIMGVLQTSATWMRIRIYPYLSEALSFGFQQLWLYYTCIYKAGWHIGWHIVLAKNLIHSFSWYSFIKAASSRNLASLAVSSALWNDRSVVSMAILLHVLEQNWCFGMV